MKINSNQILGISIIVLLVIGPFILLVFRIPLEIGVIVLFGAFALVFAWARYYQMKKQRQLKAKAEQDYIELKIKEIEERVKKTDQ